MVLRALPEAKVTQASSLTRPAGILPAEGPRAGWEACDPEQLGWLCYAAAGSFNRASLCQRNISRSVSAFFGAAPSASGHFGIMWEGP